MSTKTKSKTKSKADPLTITITRAEAKTLLAAVEATAQSGGWTPQWGVAQRLRELTGLPDDPGEHIEMCLKLQKVAKAELEEDA